MARNTEARFSQVEILELGAQFIAGTINKEAMGLYLDEKEFHKFLALFKKHFKEKATEMLKEKSALLISIGPEINTDEDGIYSKDMQVILEHVENKMQTKFYFHYGAMLILGKTQFKPCWLPHG